MKSRLFVWFALAAGAALPGASTLSAQDWRVMFQNNRDVRSDSRDIARASDRNKLDRMRGDVARDQARLNEAIRCGRSAEAARIAADMARDQRALDAQLRDTQHDRYNASFNRRDTRDTRYAYR
jgi:hypothetical protein